MNRVFVYGTLKSGNKTRGLDQFPGANLIGEAITVNADYSLFDLGAFPGVTLEGNNRIRGEVWDVDDKMFAVIDSIEGYPDLYNRAEISTTAGQAWIYYLPHVAGFHQAKQIGVGQPEKTVHW